MAAETLSAQSSLEQRFASTTQLALLPAVDPEKLIARVKLERRPVATVCLFSGGNLGAAGFYRIAKLMPRESSS